MFTKFKMLAAAMGLMLIPAAAQAAPITHTSFGVAGGFGLGDGTNLGNTNSIVIKNSGMVWVTAADPYDLNLLVTSGGTGVLQNLPSFAAFTPIMSYLSLTTGVSLDLLSLTVNSRSAGPPGFLNLSGNGVLHAPGFDATPGLFSWTGTTTDNLTFSFAVETSANTVPEPVSVALLGLGLAGLALGRKYRVRNTSV